MAEIERLRVYPVKGLDGASLETVGVRNGGTLAHDREFALFDDDGDVINGKRTPLVHELSTDYDPETTGFTVVAPDGERRSFDLEGEPDRAAAWLGEFFDASLTLERNTERGFPDRPHLGPSVVSTATVEALASWFDEMTVEGARRRLRANVEVSGVEAFWEDRFVGDDAPAFRAGDVRFEGATPCRRCVVPSRDPDTGEALANFRERFVERRRETFPDRADRAAFDGFFSLMVIARVPEADRGERLAVGDEVEVLEG